MSLPPPPPPSRLAPRPSSAPKASGKTFAVIPWTDEGQGQKILIYGPSGIGKTSLAVLAPSPIFIGLDDGGRKIALPDGTPIRAISGVETFSDLRDAIRQAGLLKSGDTMVLDTITKAEVLGEQYTFETVKGPNGAVTSVEDYGYGKGYRFLTETMRLLLVDLDSLIRKGVNVVLLAQQGQATVANLEGVDYLQDGPKLYHNKNGTGVRSEFCEWSDHILRIGFQSPAVVKDNKQATKGKASGTTDRVIYTAPELYFVAKSRPIKGKRLPSGISFAESTDDSLWNMVFKGAIP